jgi:hypothetical protein
MLTEMPPFKRKGTRIATFLPIAAGNALGGYWIAGGHC